MRDAHQRAQAGLLGLREPPKPDERERTVLVDERDDVGDGGERNDVEVPLEEWMARAEQRLRQLPDDTGAAEPGEGILALERGDDGAVREGLAGPVVIGDDDVEPQPPRLGDLLDRGDAAVDREQAANAFRGQSRHRVGVQPVALLEPRRQMPDRIGAELAQQENRERRRADPVGVVVAVHADLVAGRDGGPDRLDRRAHVAE